jgi:hypothetical protein
MPGSRAATNLAIANTGAKADNTRVQSKMRPVNDGEKVMRDLGMHKRDDSMLTKRPVLTYPKKSRKDFPRNG